ncbi:MAG: deoxynucleoside kinase [Deltaproteobacteria bacterium]|nr:deoxynucleoside kinase [Deltaproteobacteria bacterium]
MSSAVYLAVAGSIGSGKTTLTRRLEQRLGFRGLYESTADNPYLEDFYADMSRWALPLQLRFLAIRASQVREAAAHGVSVVQDRTCYEDAEIFAAHLHARGDMDERDWETYGLVTRPLLDQLPAPDLLVYLHRGPNDCRRQIRARGREYEQALPAGYLEELGERYDDFFARYARGQKLRVEGEGNDFLHSEADLDALVARVADALPQRQWLF